MEENVVEIEVVREPVKVKIDFNKLTWGRVLELQRALAADATNEKAEELVSKVISDLTGQNAYDLPAFAVTRILQEVLNFNTAKNA
jgi:hypothetical protein